MLHDGFTLAGTLHVKDMDLLPILVLPLYVSQYNVPKTKGTGRPKAATVQKYFQSGTEFIKSLEPLRFKMISVEEKIDFKIGEFNFTGRRIS